MGLVGQRFIEVLTAFCKINNNNICMHCIEVLNILLKAFYNLWL